MNYNEVVEFILKYEGGYVNYFEDSGGEINMGIFKCFYFDEDIKGMIKECVKEIYKKDFWDKVKGDEFFVFVVLVCFDIVVMFGFCRVCRMFQKVVGVKRDGIIGLVIFKVVREVYRVFEDVLVSQFLYICLEFYKRFKYFEIFGRGWINCINKIYKEVIGWINNFQIYFMRLQCKSYLSVYSQVKLLFLNFLLLLSFLRIIM